MRNGCDHVWFTVLACSLVLLNPRCSGGFRLRLATMSDEALVTRQQRMVRWPERPVLGFPPSPCRLGGRVCSVVATFVRSCPLVKRDVLRRGWW